MTYQSNTLWTTNLGVFPVTYQSNTLWTTNLGVFPVTYQSNTLWTTNLGVFPVTYQSNTLWTTNLGVFPVTYQSNTLWTTNLGVFPVTVSMEAGLLLGLIGVGSVQHYSIRRLSHPTVSFCSSSSNHLIDVVARFPSRLFADQQKCTRNNKGQLV